jgi:ethanolamine ammonia-lyase small subunit
MESKMNKHLRHWTEARVGLGRHGSSLPTDQHLALLEAQALARDSLWREWDTRPLSVYLQAQAWPHFEVQTEINDRQQYLMRPDLGRRLAAASRLHLQEKSADPERTFDNEVVFCVSDGLATDAIEKHMQPFLDIFLPRLQLEAFYRQKPYPFVLAPLSRVAVSDPIGEALGARLSVIFVGERPGLSAHDSLGIYLTLQPKSGLPDSRRNCISNVRMPQGLNYQLAADQLLYLMRESLRLGLSGVDLKMDLALPAEKWQIKSGK